MSIAPSTWQLGQRPEIAGRGSVHAILSTQQALD
jgi:hypothetical protein